MKKPVLALALLWLWVALVAGAAAESLQESRAKAEKGDAVAQWSLGERYASGDGVKQDWAQARAWIEKAANGGPALAQVFLGMMYANGKGGKQDWVQARAWYEKAAAQGHAYAQFLLGDIYANGQGVKQDWVQARAWYEKAAVRGDADAQTTMGIMYTQGLGGEKDLAKAKDWYQKAVAQGLEEAKGLLAELEVSEGSAEAGKVVQANRGKEGQTIDLKSLAVPGRRVLVDFYSPLCPPCVQLTPRLEALAAKTDWIVMKVNINRPGIEEIDWESPVAKQFELEGVPHLLVLDRQGKTAAEGGIAMAIIERQMQKAGVE